MHSISLTSSEIGVSYSRYHADRMLNSTQSFIRNQHISNKLMISNHINNSVLVKDDDINNVFSSIMQTVIQSQDFFS